MDFGLQYPLSQGFSNQNWNFISVKYRDTSENSILGNQQMQIITNKYNVPQLLAVTKHT